MTREEAISVLKVLASFQGVMEYLEQHSVSVQDACNMAIQALSQEPCTDAVSRQAILDGIDELKKSPWATDKRGNGFEYLITEALDVVADLCVKQLPSVTQKSAESEDKTE